MLVVPTAIKNLAAMYVHFREMRLGRSVPFLTLIGFLTLIRITAAQQPEPAPPQPGVLKNTTSANPNPPESKRIFWIIPNYRTSPTLHPYVPMTAKQKLTIASEDAFDRGTIVLAGLFAGLGQLRNSDPSFGQGLAGYGRYFGTAYADFVIGDYMTEGFYPVLLHQDPRYFRDGQGTTRSRLLHAVGQIFMTHGDNGRTQFNFSEIVGNSTAVAISQAYYPDNHNWHDASISLASQLGVDMAANTLKEFWPDLNRKFGHKKHE